MSGGSRLTAPYPEEQRPWAGAKNPARRNAMAVVKVIELLGESGESWEDATRQVVAEATKTLHGVTSVYVKEFQATVENDKVKNFRVDAKVSFKLERK
jgi:dodecin